MASKVGWAPPYVRPQLAVPTFPCVGTESGPGPPLSSDMRGQAGALVLTAGECGDGWMAGTAPNVSLLSLCPLAAADRPPGECWPPLLWGTPARHLCLPVRGWGAASCACQGACLTEGHGPSTSTRGPACQQSPPGGTVVTLSLCVLTCEPRLSCLLSPSRSRGLAAGDGGMSPPFFLGEQMTPQTGMAGDRPGMGPLSGVFPTGSLGGSQGPQGPSAVAQFF